MPHTVTKTKKVSKSVAKPKKGKYEPAGYVLKIQRSTAGLGLFAGEDIPKGQCLIEYIGRVISKEEEYTSRSQYLFEVSKNKTIDGTMRENTARYINHSHRPNCEVEIYKGRVFVFSKRAIKAGEELAYDYGKDFVDEWIKSKPGGCRCVKCAEAKKTKVS
jgi:SET domain-containing protein